MKVRLTIDLELPEAYDAYTDQEVRQLLFDAYIHQVTCAHLDTAVDVLAQITAVAVPDNLICAYKQHKMWSAICKKAAWSWERIE